MASDPHPELDFLLVGGGLGNALIALALFDARPDVRIGLVERGQSIGGNHLWCFHAGDVDERASRFVAPLVSQRWPRYDVCFPRLTRTLEEPYAAVRSDRLDEVVRAAFEQRGDSRLILGKRAVRCTSDRVALEDGSELRAHTVIESRGPDALTAGDDAGFQKFLGLELKLKRPSPLAHPVLMDALLPQRDGFRFMYALPFGTDRVLLEDTYFSDSRELDLVASRREILEYAARNGFEVDHVLREEVGVLPLPTRLARVANPAPDGPLVAGYQGAWFHPVTGYSFPLAARLAVAVASTPPEALREKVWPELVVQQRAQLRFCLWLNRLFFGAFAPDQRVNVIERFYRLPPEAVRRFYAMTLSPTDRARILCGRPPRGFSLARLARGASSASPSRPSPEGALS